MSASNTNKATEIKGNHPALPFLLCLEGDNEKDHANLCSLKEKCGSTPYKLLGCPHCHNFATIWSDNQEYIWAVDLQCAFCKDSSWTVCKICSRACTHMQQKRQLKAHDKAHGKAHGNAHSNVYYSPAPNTTSSQLFPCSNDTSNTPTKEFAHLS